MIDCRRIAEALAHYDPNASADAVAQGEEERKQLVARFPKDGWPAMTLDDYALGQPSHQDNFCRWMEFVTAQLGSIRGGSARKHLIYFQASTNRWWFDEKLYNSVEEAWDAVHQGFIDAIKLAETGDWDGIAQIASLRAGPALLNKTLSVYFPDQILPINSQTHLRHFLRELGEPRADDQSLGTTTLNRLLLEGLRACAELDGWSTKEMERLLYTEFDPFIALLPTSPIKDVAAFIATMVDELGQARLEARRHSEDQARLLLDEFAGEMTEEQARSLLSLFNADLSNGGKPRSNRFSPAFVGQTANALIADLANFNLWTQRLWKGTDEERTRAVGQLLENRKLLPSAGTSYPTMLAYLAAPDSAAVWLQITDRGLQRLAEYKPSRSPGNGRAQDYEQFCTVATRLMNEYEIPPELLDAVLAEAGRAQAQPAAEQKPSAVNVWMFQANPSVYDIDQALSELGELDWVVRQYKSEIKRGDKAYIWRSGAEAGVIATATVITNPAELPGDKDPYVLRPESLSKPELRVMLRVEAVLPEVVRRSDLLEHAVLKDLEVIRQAQGTNFRVSAEQDEALEALVTGFRIPTLRVSIEERVFLPRDWLQEAIDLLADKGQIVLYGPPGTGKTFVALALAEELTRDGGDFRIVQFHPSYSYEDFVGGFRPVEDDGAHGVRYQRTNGPLRELATAAAADPRHPYVLIIDEINRGNIPKIFGELLFLLEYRLKAVRLQYWPEEPFSLPPNLFVIGTMNTADRSIALVDAALRRRFYFFEFTPRAEPVRSVLAKWLKRHQQDSEAADLLAALNEEIANDEVAIGPSYFMTDPDAGPDLERIWQRAIMPLLDEYFYGTKWDPTRFSLAKLRSRLHTPTGPDTSGEPEGAQEPQP